MKRVFIGAIAGWAMLLGNAPAFSQIQPASTMVAAPRDEAGATSIREFGFTLAPLAFVKFCMQNGAECEASTGAGDEKELSLSELQSVNRQVNDAISPRRKPTEPLSANWTIAPSSGDCNDYAVTKRSRLVAAGWPSQQLRLAVVITPTGQGHLVLVARMPQGDMVLDNLTDSVRPWQDTGYDWVSMQSNENPRVWVAVGERGRQRQQRFQALAANFN